MADFDKIAILVTIAFIVVLFIVRLRFKLKTREYKKEDVYVYIIENTYLHDTKIGISNNPEKRIKQLQTGSSRQLVIRHTIKFDNRDAATKVESSLHRKYSKYRLTGEWFEIDCNKVIKYVDDKFNIK